MHSDRYLKNPKKFWLNENISREIKHSGTDEQDVDVSSDARAVLQHLLHAAQQHAKDGLLDVLVAVDTGSQGASQLIKHILRKRRRKQIKYNYCKVS